MVLVLISISISRENEQKRSDALREMQNRWAEIYDAMNEVLERISAIK
ncbi:MAG: hypothetical protein HFE97_00545 [Oscillospiraceae bacterium]|nr:hypothetical protein [Oscillospiraceae bacterium]